MGRKRRSNDLVFLGDSENRKKRKISLKKSNTIIAENIEIIKLTDVSEDEDDEDCEWEDVSDLSETKGIVINMNDSDSDDRPKKSKTLRQRVNNKDDKILQRTMLMSLFARLIHIDKSCTDDMVKHLALSHLPLIYVDSDCDSISLKNIRAIIFSIKSQFEVDDQNECGNVRVILLRALQENLVPLSFVNLVVLAVLRSGGFNARLVGSMYPRGVVSGDVLVPPTIYRPSSRGGHVKSSQTRFMSLPPKKKSTIILTIEVFLKKAHRWIPVDANDMTTFDDVAGITKDHPRSFYVLGINNDGFVKDVTPRYDPSWADSSRRSRLSRDSWLRILAPFLQSPDPIEDKLLMSNVLQKGIPRTLADLKGHPLFVLKRHLLKYEVIYPPDVAPFDQFNDEEVYLRDNVKVAHTRETWLKEAMVVKNGEVACKRVKTMMATRKQKTHGTDPYVDIFGPWQIEKFVPPKAENGIVPVNCHGNVDLFQPCMLPEGCVLITMNGVDKVAKKLQVDCAAAMVGWGFVKGNRAVPIFDGWVVCEESAQLLKDALFEMNKLEALKRAEKHQIIVVKRWETLTRRMLLKERLRMEYNF